MERFGSIRAAHSVVRRVTGQATARSPKAMEARFATNRELLQGLVAYLSQHGRAPEADECPDADELISVFGSLQAAVRLVEAVLGTEQWESVRQQRRQDLTVYLALAAFGGRSRLSELPVSLQRDVRAAFTTYRRACEESDALLFAAGDATIVDASCAAASIGKLTPEALMCIERLSVSYHRYSASLKDAAACSRGQCQERPSSS